MIIEDIFFAEIQLENGDVDGFVDKSWYALNIHKTYLDEKIGNNAFLDWARDLDWIPQKHIVIIVKGVVEAGAREIIEFLDDYWEKEFYEIDGDARREKQVDFILVPNDK